jgi:hypothetical protein
MANLADSIACHAAACAAMRDRATLRQTRVSLGDYHVYVDRFVWARATLDLPMSSAIRRRGQLSRRQVPATRPSPRQP